MSIDISFGMDKEPQAWISWNIGYLTEIYREHRDKITFCIREGCRSTSFYGTFDVFNKRLFIIRCTQCNTIQKTIEVNRQ